MCINGIRIALILVLIAILFMSNVISNLDTDVVIQRYNEIMAQNDLNYYQSAILWSAELANKYCEIIPTITAAISTVATAVIAWFLGKK